MASFSRKVLAFLSRVVEKVSIWDDVVVRSGNADRHIFGILTCGIHLIGRTSCIYKNSASFVQISTFRNVLPKW